jgi:hypothetical protein
MFGNCVWKDCQKLLNSVKLSKKGLSVGVMFGLKSYGIKGGAEELWRECSKQSMWEDPGEILTGVQLTSYICPEWAGTGV